MMGRPAKHPLSQRAQAQGLTLAQVAERAGISRAKLANLMQGQDCTITLARRLAEILGADVADLGLEVVNTNSTMRWCRRVITTAHTRKIADALGVSISTVQRWRNPGNRGPTPAQITVIEKITGHPLTDPAAVCAACGQELLDAP